MFSQKSKYCSVGILVDCVFAEKSKYCSVWNDGQDCVFSEKSKCSCIGMMVNTFFSENSEYCNVSMMVNCVFSKIKVV